MTRAWLVLLLLGCGASAPAPATVVESSSAGAEIVAPDAVGLADATLADLCGAGVVTLESGVAQYDSGMGEGFEGELELQPITAVDLDGDGAVEYLALLVCRPGGSGTFDAVWAFHRSGEHYQGIAHIEGGDRADGGLDGARVENGTVVVGRYSGDEEGVCCPTHVAREVWRLVGDRFERIEASPPEPIEH